MAACFAGDLPLGVASPGLQWLGSAAKIGRGTVFARHHLRTIAPSFGHYSGIHYASFAGRNSDGVIDELHVAAARQRVDRGKRRVDRIA